MKGLKGYVLMGKHKAAEVSALPAVVRPYTLQLIDKTTGNQWVSTFCDPKKNFMLFFCFY